MLLTRYTVSLKESYNLFNTKEGVEVSLKCRDREVRLSVHLFRKLFSFIKIKQQFTKVER